MWTRQAIGTVEPEEVTMHTGARTLGDRGGFSLPELLVVLVVIGIMTAMSVPSFLSYWHSATVRAGTQELASILNRARQIAISRNTNVCVKRNASNQVQILRDAAVAGLVCVGTVWTGPGTDGAGQITLQNRVNVTAATANVVFTYLGAANPAGAFTVQNPANNSTMRVTVASSGRVTIGP
jgi:prepilin-type N-terminal cleavage/methylation domain-containing protein